MYILDDFPRYASLVAAASRGGPVSAGLFNNVGLSTTDDDPVADRYELCEDLARQLRAVALRKAGCHSRAYALKYIRTTLTKRSWMTPAELEWLMRRLQTLLDW